LKKKPILEVLYLYLQIFLNVFSVVYQRDIEILYVLSFLRALDIMFVQISYGNGVYFFTSFRHRISRRPLTDYGR